ncbi:MAG: aminotransferase class I/II-fold pyridoxal phosphate-dependent enzyme, partial [Chloroflexi bacterium]|nr:aminotransferase class I/II-fold pyridoxal phosphate-dependent enzyme [Chloroflexota bacterium]
MHLANRIATLPPYLFAEVNKRIAAKRAQGVDVINLGIGDPDLPPPAHLVEAVQKAAADPAAHRYPNYYGLPELKEAFAHWFASRFGVRLDPQSEVAPVAGTKEGLIHLPWALVNPGDVVLLPDPGYPPYNIGTLLAGGEPYALPLLAKRGWQPDLRAIPADVAARARLLILCYPNNPTGATLPNLALFEEAVAFARQHDLIVVHDAAYSEVYYGSYRPPSFLQVPGAREVGVEFHSLSKTYSLAGWRLGFLVGNAQVVKALADLKTNIDSGI